MCGQRHAPTALPPGKSTDNTCKRWALGSVWKRVENKRSLAPTGLRTTNQTTNHPVRSESLYRLRYFAPVPHKYSTKQKRRSSRLNRSTSIHKNKKTIVLLLTKVKCSPWIRNTSYCNMNSMGLRKTRIANIPVWVPSSNIKQRERLCRYTSEQFVNDIKFWTCVCVSNTTNVSASVYLEQAHALKKVRAMIPLDNVSKVRPNIWHHLLPTTENLQSKNSLLCISLF
jgi:hypothetical protein